MSASGRKRTLASAISNVSPGDGFDAPGSEIAIAAYLRRAERCTGQGVIRKERAPYTPARRFQTCTLAHLVHAHQVAPVRVNERLVLAVRGDQAAAVLLDGVPVPWVAVRPIRRSNDLVHLIPRSMRKTFAGADRDNAIEPLITRIRSSEDRHDAKVVAGAVHVLAAR